MMAVGVAAGLWFIYVQAKKAGMEADRVMDAAFYTIIVTLLGAKLLLFASNISYYVSYPKELFSLARSGGVFQGGLTFGVIFALWYFRRKKIPTWATGDIVAPALALGHGFGRIGCFSAGCCYGSECALPWAAVFKNEYASELTGVHLHTPLHPVQLYEAVLNFLNFAVLFVILKKKRFAARSSPFISPTTRSSGCDLRKGIHGRTIQRIQPDHPGRGLPALCSRSRISSRRNL